MIAGIIVIAVVVILLLACVGGYNTLVKGRITVDEAFSTTAICNNMGANAYDYNACVTVL